MSLAPGTRIGPYEIVEPLGTGGMGEVYRARDPRLGRPVALKIVAPHPHDDHPSLDRFAREARAASSLNHPNIVTIYDIGESPHGRYIAMELVDGRTLRALARETKALDVVHNVGLQVAKALAAAHAAGIVHRDIKPDNVMVRHDGYVKVLDFGLARMVADNPADELTHSEETEAGTVLGTVQYMSPEQARAESVTAATDVFSLGAVLFELACGEHPFATRSRLATVAAILSQHPVLPSRLNPEISAGFESLLLAMLEKDPRARPTAAMIQAQLDALISGREIPPSIVSPAGARRKPLIGREAEKAELAASLDSVATERGLMHAVVAEAGFGKTTVVEHFLQSVTDRSRGYRIGRGRCSERLAGTEAYLPFLEALDGLLHGESGDAVARAMRVVAPAWFSQLNPSSVSGSSASGTQAMSEPRAGSSEQMKRQLGALLQELTRSSPIVLFLDDVHWADASTVDLIGYLGDRFDSLRVLLLVTYRPSDLLLAHHPFIEVKLNLQSRGACRETQLQPFDRQETARYLATAYPRNDFPEGFVTLLHTRTEGTPLFVVDLMRQLVDRGVVAQRDGVWGLAQSVESLESDLPESIRSGIQRTIDRLDEADRRLLVAASVQGAEFDSAVAARAIDMDSEEVEERLERLERLYALVKLVDERELARRTPSLRYAFAHIFYQNALHSTLRATRRVALSGAVAAAMEEYYGEDSSMALQLAVLHETARHYQEAATYYLTAVRTAARLFANKEAVLLARRGIDAVSKMPDSPERARIELKLQVALGVPLTGLHGYATPEVEKVYSRARDLCRTLGDTPTQIPVLHGLYRFYTVRGQLHTAHEIVEQLVAVAESTQDPNQILVARVALGAPLIHLARFEEAVDHLQSGLALYNPANHVGDRLIYGADPGMSALLWLAVAQWLLGRPDEALESNRRAHEIADRQQYPFALAYAANLSAWLHQYRGDAAMTRQYAENSIQISRVHDFVQWLALGMMYRSWALVALGDYPDGIAELSRGIESFRRTGAELNLPHFLSLLADAHLRAGDASAGLDVIQRALAVLEKNDDRCWEPEIYRLKGELSLKAAGPGSADGIARGEQAFREAVAIAQRQKSYSLGLRAALSLARLLAATDRSAEAHSALTQSLEQWPENMRAPEVDAARMLLGQNAV